MQRSLPHEGWLYAKGAYATPAERRRLAALVRREDAVSWPSRFGRRAPAEHQPATPPIVTQQTALF